MIIDTKNHVRYQIKSSMLQGRVDFYNNEQLLYTADRVFGLRLQYSLKKNGIEVCLIKAKTLFMFNKFQIESEYGDYQLIGKSPFEEFQILNHNQVVLSIKKDIKKVYHKVILVEESQLELLLMMMVVLIHDAQIDRSSV